MTAVSSLIVRLETSSDPNSGTNDHVYFGIGTREWNLDTDRDDFEPGQTRDYTLVVSPGLDDSHIQAIQLRKTGSDGWKPRSIEVWVNDPAMSGTPLYRGTIDMFLDGVEGPGLEHGLRWQAPDFGAPAVLPPGQSDAAITSFEVELTTAAGSDSGTDDPVYLDIGTREWMLDKADHNDFEPGATDTFTLSNFGALRLSHIRRIGLRKAGTNGWKVEHIKVTINGTEMLDEAVGVWLDGGAGAELEHGKFWASRNFPTPQPATPEDAITKLLVTVETQDVEHAETNDHIYFNIGTREWTLGDPASHFGRNSSHTFDLRNITGLRRSDFRQIMVRKEGTDGWALKSVKVRVEIDNAPGAAIESTLYEGDSPVFLDGGSAEDANKHGLYWSAPDFDGPCSAWLPAVASNDYTDWVAAPTRGRITLLINGRNSNGPAADIDLTEMETAIRALGPGDFVYLSSWFFGPETDLQMGAYDGETTWGGLLGKKAEEGVEVRILINDFDPFSGLDVWQRDHGITPLETRVLGLSAAARARFKYVVSRHPASYAGVRAQAIRNMFRGGSGPIFIGSHHQKFMVTRKGNETIAFCGGLDIERLKVPSAWSYAGFIGWHDLTVKLEGPITREVERQFVERWNREHGDARNALLPDWVEFGTLTQPSQLHADDDTAAKRVNPVQLTRTISSGASFSAYANNRSDIRQAYSRIIGCAGSFLYLENQYFRDLSLADEIAARGRRYSDLQAIFVVLANVARDDGTNPLTLHGMSLQHEFFTRVDAAFGARAGIYFMWNRSVHSKMLLADDRMMSIGSANANVRSFELDSELNVTIDDRSWVRAARERMWAHNLGIPASTVRTWRVGDFLARWNTVAANNDVVGTTGFDKMTGEAVLEFPWSRIPGSPSPVVPDYLVRLDFGPGETGAVVAMDSLPTDSAPA